MSVGRTAIKSRAKQVEVINSHQHSSRSNRKKWGASDSVSRGNSNESSKKQQLDSFNQPEYPLEKVKFMLLIWGDYLHPLEKDRHDRNEMEGEGVYQTN